MAKLRLSLLPGEEARETLVLEELTSQIKPLCQAASAPESQGPGPLLNPASQILPMAS